MTYETVGLLAGAYNSQTEKAAVTHAYRAGEPKTLCRRVLAEKLADTLGGVDPAAEPTCPACRKRDPRFP